MIPFFLLISGDTFLRRLVEIVPMFKDKRRVVALSQQIEENISAYLVTVTLMNAAVCAATAVAMWACGLGDPLLWGGVAFILNYVPSSARLPEWDFFSSPVFSQWAGCGRRCFPPGFILRFTLIEGEALTPMLLARRFTLILWSWSSPWFSGFGCGEFPAQFSPFR